MSTWAKNAIERTIETTPARTVDISVRAAARTAEAMVGVSLDQESITEAVLATGVTRDTEAEVIADAVWDAVVKSALAGETICSTDRDATDSLGRTMHIGSVIAYASLGPDDLPYLNHGIVSTIEHRDYGVIALVNVLLDGSAASRGLGPDEVDRTIAVTINK